MNAAFIPVRGGSKSIPLKNIKKICGMPLVYWTVKAAADCEHIDIVYVATDSEIIEKTVKSFNLPKVMVIGRSAESASDTASTEFAMLEFAENYDFDNITLIQATSPLLTAEDLNKGFELFNKNGTDSVISAVRQKRFNWQIDENGFANPTNYDVFNRPRRQEFDGYLVENGAFYITSKADLLKSRNRVSGNIKAVEMSEDTFFEIDEPSDWVIIESLMKRKGLHKNEIPEIKMFLTDCDGCLTDAGMYYSEFGDELKKFNTKDGMAFGLMRKKGILTGIVTSESVELNKRRAEKLKLDILEAGTKNKVQAITALSQNYNIPLENICYIGDDINDTDVFDIVGFSACPADAASLAKSKASYITSAKGGEGVIREVFELIFG